MPQVFAAPVFFICLRECIETSIVISVLLSFLKQTLPSQGDAGLQRKLVRQIWFGVASGLFLAVCIGAGMIGAFYGLGKNVFSKTEDLWEGVFSLIAALIITVMGAALLRVSKLQDKWKVKIAKVIDSRYQPTRRSVRRRFKLWAEKYAMFMLPFITVLREGLEAVTFIAGVGLGQPASSFPLAVFTGLLAGGLIGWLIYKGGNRASLQIFLIISTCFLYLVAAGLFSRSMWFFQARAWNRMVGGDASETGSGPGSYNIRWSVWHVNCCNPQVGGGGGWGVFNSLFGWTNSATYGSVISYNLYWVAVILGFAAMRYNEIHGHWPFLKKKSTTDTADSAESPHVSGQNSQPANSMTSQEDLSRVSSQEKADIPHNRPRTMVQELKE